MDFYQIKERMQNRSTETDFEKKKFKALEIYPDFCPIHSKDLMIRGRSFYAIWDEESQLWSTDEADVQRLVDQDLDKYKEQRKTTWPGDIEVKRMISFSSNVWRNYRLFLREMFDTAHQLDERLTFSNTIVKKTDYASLRLPYPLEEGPCEAYTELMSTLYEQEERDKLEWAIGSIIAGDAKDIQKFIVLFGEFGSGKSTFLNIVQKLFKGYYTTFEAKALTSSSNAFSTEVFKANPLVAIQHDGDLSRIEDNTKLNSIISHEEMTMNEKYKPAYKSHSNAFLFMGTNKPVKITDAKSGIIRRLIDVHPSGKTVPTQKYHTLISKIDFELGAIAYHCLNRYTTLGKNYYAAYRPLEMMYQTDVFFNFVEDSYYVFSEQEGISLNQAYEMYKQYCDDALVEYKLAKHKFREELKSYFEDFSDRTRIDGKQVRSYYSGFLRAKFNQAEKTVDEKPLSLALDYDVSILDDILSECPAQYATTNGIPTKTWAEVKTKLEDLDTKKIHFVRPPDNHIVIDFDLKDSSGHKSMELNLQAASIWPSTYSEFSKSGAGIHLHYIYDGDTSLLSNIYAEDIEVKVFSGKSSLRRKLSKCNNLPIATINSGLPLKGEKMINFEKVRSEKSLRNLINRNLNKEIHQGTKPSIDFIYKLLDDAYNSGMNYDVTDMRPRILSFAAHSTNHSEYCIKLMNKMMFQSVENSESQVSDNEDLIFFDLEVFPNLFVAVWKKTGGSCVMLINPTPSEIEELLQFRLVGFNCRRYDNHILYASYIGYTNYQLYELSQKIINGSKNCFFGEAYNISYTDVFDFASASNKKGLKKFEIELGIHHQELGLPWDQPVDESLWPLVAQYCCNDVEATEATFYYLSEDWLARQILADIAGMTVNDTTNSLTTKIIFGDCKNPQPYFNWRDLSEPVLDMKDLSMLDFLTESFPEMMAVKHGKANSILPYFKDYEFEGGKSTYMGETVGEGGWVYSEPGIYSDTVVLDIVSMHPHSAMLEVVFGVEFTKKFKELVDGRVSIKHEAWDDVEQILDGKLVKYIQQVKTGELKSSNLANSLKTAINSVYGLTSARFDNKFKDPRNKDNIIAKRGALFMITLKQEVEKRGFPVIHIKTDSIKIPNATPEIINFVMEYGKLFGYTFEHESTYEKICLVNDAVYIAQYATAEKCKALYEYVPKEVLKHGGKWTATGTQFAQPYVFKTLFSHEPITFEDTCEIKTVTTALYLDMNELLSEDEHDYHFIGKTGAFCPVLEGFGGGVLYREKDGKYGAASGTKNYRWLEAEMVKSLGRSEIINLEYYNKMVDGAIDTISKYGDFEQFVSDYINDPDLETPIGFNDSPPWNMPCGKKDCQGCDDWVDVTQTEEGKYICRAGYECLPF